MLGSALCVKDIWRKASSVLREISEDTYEQWFKSIVPLSVDEEKITLGVSDDFFAEWIKSNYDDILSDTLYKVSAKRFEINFESGHIADEDQSMELEENFTPQLSDNADLDADDSDDEESDKYVCAPNCHARHSFANFVVGEENRYAHAAAKTASEAPGIYNPLYIYGGTGMGKTHLLHAVAHKTLTDNPRAKVEYMPCEEFLNYYVDSLRRKRHSEFRNRFRSVDVLLIDDVHQLANKTQLQEEFFNTFNTLYNNNKQIILTSDRQPCEIKGLEDRLVSRFESGFTTEITTASVETRLAILKMKQEDHVLKLDDDVLFFLASRISSSIRRLQGALFRLVGYSSAMGGCKITIEKAEELLGKLLDEEAVNSQVTIENIQKTVAEFFGIHVHDILGKKRPKNIAEPRQVAMYLSRKLTDHSFPEIGVAFGGRNHGTIMHAVKEIKNRCESNETFKRTVSSIQKQLQG